MMKSATRTRLLERSLRSSDDARGRRVDLRFERRGSGSRDEPRAYPLNGRCELAEALSLQGGDDFCSGTGEVGTVYDIGVEIGVITS